MTLDEQLATYLQADPGITALTPDVWLAVLPQGTRKGVAMSQIGAQRDVTLDLRVSINARWQFSSYAESISDARALHLAVAAAVEFLNRTALSGGTVITTEALSDERGPLFDYDQQLYRYDAEIFIFYNPS